MPRVIRTACLLPALLALACGGAAAFVPDPLQAQLTADALREGEVASTLDVFQRVVDLTAPATGVADFSGLADLAERAGCVLLALEDGSYELRCPAFEVRGEAASLRVVLTYLDAGLPVPDPAQADAVRVTVEVDGASLETDGVLDLFEDLDRGLVIDGSLDTLWFDGSTLNASVDQVTARTIADLPGLALGALFTSGNVDLGVRTPAGEQFTGTAGMVGRSAVVALEVFGVFSQGEIALGVSGD